MSGTRVAIDNPSTTAPVSGSSSMPEPRSGIPFWIPLGVALVALMALAIRAAGPITDPDTWWHLRLGEEFSGHWSLSNPGQLSPFGDRPWFATQWTLEVIAARLEQAFGLAGSLG